METLVNLRKDNPWIVSGGITESTVAAGGSAFTEMVSCICDEQNNDIIICLKQ